MRRDSRKENRDEGSHSLEDSQALIKENGIVEHKEDEVKNRVTVEVTSFQSLKVSLVEILDHPMTWVLRLFFLIILNPYTNGTCNNKM